MNIDISSVLVGLVVGGVASSLTAWAIFGKFLARDAEREKHWVMWRTNVDERLDSHAADIKDHGSRLVRMERNGR